MAESSESDADASATQESELWSRLKRSKDQDARDQLIARYQWLAKAAAARCLRERNFDADLDRKELDQSAMVGLIEAVHRYDAELGVPFPAFAKKRIHGSLIDDISRNSEQKEQAAWLRQIRKERIESFHGAGESAGTLEQLAEVAIGLALGFMLEDSGMYQSRDERSGPYESNELAVLQAQLQVVFVELAPHQRRILEYHYFGELSFAEIGKLLEISKVRVFQIHKKAIADLRKRLRALGRLEQVA